MKAQALYWAPVTLSSLLAPLLWMLIMVNGEDNRPTSLFFSEWHFFGSYLFPPNKLCESERLFAARNRDSDF